MISLCISIGKANVVADALSRKSRGALASIASQEWWMLETVGQFELQYSEQTQGTLGSLVTTPSLLSRVIESQWQDVEIVSNRDQYSPVQVTRVGPFTQMVVFDIGDG